MASKKKNKVQRHVVVNSASWMADLPMDILWQQEQFIRTLMSEKLPMWFAPLFMRFAEHLYQPTRYATHVYHGVRTPGHRRWFLSLHALGSVDVLKVLDVAVINTMGEMPPKHERAIVYKPDGPYEPFAEEFRLWSRTAGPARTGWYSFDASVRRLLCALYRSGVEMWHEPSEAEGSFTVWMYHDRSLVRLDFRSQTGQVWGSH